MLVSFTKDDELKPFEKPVFLAVFILTHFLNEFDNFILHAYGEGQGRAV